MSSYVTFEFESNISYINILCWDLIFPQFFLTLWIFMTNFEISIFHKMPAAAVLRLLRLRPQLRLRLRLRLRSKLLAATRGTVYTLFFHLCFLTLVVLILYLFVQNCSLTQKMFSSCRRGLLMNKDAVTMPPGGTSTQYWAETNLFWRPRSMKNWVTFLVFQKNKKTM